MQNSLSTIKHAPSKKALEVPPSANLVSDEIKFLITCCKTSPSQEDIAFIRNCLSQIDTENSFLTFTASRHGILPLVYKTLKKIVDLELPLNASRFTLHAEILTELKAQYMSISQRNMLMSAELIRIMKLLEANSIEVLAFKGPALAQQAYGDITLRQFGDLDILIKRSDISPVIDLLAADGYVLQLELDTKMKETFLSALNVIGFYKNATNVLIEVHWGLLSKNYAIHWDENTLWGQKKESTTINNRHIQVLPPEEQILYLCVHGSKHLFERLEWICDIDRSIRANPDINWDYLLKKAEKRGIKRMLCLGMALCEQFFCLALPDSIRNEIEKEEMLPKLISKVIEINFSKTAQGGKDYSYFMLMWNMREKLSDKLRFAWYAFFAPQFDDYTFINLPKYLAFLYPIIRPFRLVTKYFKP